MRQASQIPVHRMSDWHTGDIKVRRIEITTIPAPAIGVHRDDHYLFFLQRGGNNTFMVDFKEMCVQGDSVFCILPGQVHHLISSQPGKVWVLALDTSLVEDVYRHVFEVDMIRIDPLMLSPAMSSRLEGIIDALCDLLDETGNRTQRSVQLHMASAYIGIIAGLYLEAAETNSRWGGRMADIVRQFRSLLKRNFREEKSPAGYAESMNLSLSYLNECVKQFTGMPVSYWIQQEIILEAKRLLYYTSLSVKQIALNLGYTDHAYFSRIFLKTAGLTPGQFRKSYHE